MHPDNNRDQWNSSQVSTPKMILALILASLFSLSFASQPQGYSENMLDFPENTFGNRVNFLVETESKSLKPNAKSAFKPFASKTRTRSSTVRARKSYAKEVRRDGNATARKVPVIVVDGVTSVPGSYRRHPATPYSINGVVLLLPNPFNNEKIQNANTEKKACGVCFGCVEKKNSEAKQ